MSVEFAAPPLLMESSIELGSLERSYEFERIDVEWWKGVLRRNWAWGIYAAVIYLVVVFGLERWMRGRKALGLKIPLVLWNAGLGVFSVAGFLRSAPVLGRDLGVGGFYGSVCVGGRIDVVMAYWGLLFAISKFVELGDTVFIVLRKRPLQLLQYYHHVATLIVVWISTPDAEPVGRYYIVANYGVHSLMYPYFAAKMAGVNVPKVVANFITTMQFVQMVVGFALNAVTIGLLASGYACYRTRQSIIAFVAVYGSFVVLFGRLFKSSVLKRRNVKVE